MSAHLILVMEKPVISLDLEIPTFQALPSVIELHPALSPLLEFEAVDPAQIAVEVGMTYAYDAEDVEDLQDIQWDPLEWFEAAQGLAVVRQALSALRLDPDMLARVLYNPKLRSADVIAELEAIEYALALAQDQETRFHFVLLN